MESEPSEVDVVGDDETLYRAVRNLPQNFAADSEGAVRLSSQAFSDRRMRPSVDRARLRNNDPTQTQFDPTDSVVSVTAQQVRSLQATSNDAKGDPLPDRVYIADVEPVPLPDNPAHAEIYGRPAFDNKPVFRRICDMLARLAQWKISIADAVQDD